ncbi:hypothetical protein KPH14_011458 [Odynerus spinipes]|uniref:Epoxide hydrolase n=1 Tax=Odynerus spinipes TaxID=1348599 RepID=A0AAD9VTV9_9HYME|nr:hypothetical protein KPH14_011458 [Odynerus spinipes]
MWKTTTVILVLSVGAYQLLSQSETTKPDLPETFWGPSKNKAASKEIVPFKINVPQGVIDDLKRRLENPRLDVEPLEGAAWTYGLPTTSAKKIISYWRTKYNWTERQALLNKYPQFITNIQGLNIHFYHVKPNLPKDRKVKVLPLLIVHGWPGSVVEFQKIFPLLTTPRPDQDFVFEVIAPSLPGYGFSDAPVRPGMAAAQIGVVFNTLMSRLGFDKFYAQGGDWGGVTVASMAALSPERIIGVHSNMCVGSKPWNFWNLIGSVFPSLVVEKEHEHKMYPLTKRWALLLEETGYMHIQATKPDTIGTALTNSPVSLAIYILEKFSTWTNEAYKTREDGGLTEKFTLDELLDNVMIYWVTDSITTSVRLYAEQFNSTNMKMDIDSIPIDVPSACVMYPHELVYVPEKILRSRYHNLIHFRNMPKGGHFPAFEEPQIFADDVYKFVNKVEEQTKNERKKTVVPEQDKKKPKTT